MWGREIWRDQCAPLRNLIGMNRCQEYNWLQATMPQGPSKFFLIYFFHPSPIPHSHIYLPVLNLLTIQQFVNRHMQLRNIINEEYPISTCHFSHKIIHQLNNQGCRCHLCQKIVINQNKVIKKVSFTDHQSELTKGKKQEFLVPFLYEFYFMDKLTRKIKFMIPEICIFQKGSPTTLITKKRETGPMKIVKNKEKLNAFEIQNFFTDGYIVHNNIKENDKDMTKYKNLSKEQYYNYRELLKNECIILVKFNNGTCQMMSLLELNNLFKSKQRQMRNEILNISTLVNAKEHNEIRVHIHGDTHMKGPVFERAKTEVKIINEDIKQKDFMFVSEKDERAFEDQLKEKDKKAYLEYVSLKLLLLYSLKTDVLLESCLFKYIKGEGDAYYLTDIQLYKKTSAGKVWGEFKHIMEEKQSPSPTKKRQRPTSSPQRLQGIGQVNKTEENREDKSISFKLMKQNEKIKNMIRERAKTSSLFKLQPIHTAKATRDR